MRVCVCDTCDDGVALVVEGAGEDLVSMALQDLQTDSRADVPQTGRPVRASREEPSTLGAETHLQGAAGETTSVWLISEDLKKKKNIKTSKFSRLFKCFRQRENT